MSKQPIIQVQKMFKNFGPTKALRGVDVDFYPGEIRGLVGENGSGKSTITSIISGMQKQTEGKMYYDGKEWNPHSMVEAQKHGISMILQEANTISGCTVAENIFAGRFDEFSKLGLIKKKEMNKKAQEMLDQLEISHIKATDMIDKYGFEERKLVEIVRCVSDETKVLIVDETTTALSREGRNFLYKLIHKMKDEGKTVIFISHDMDEIMEQCTALTVLRDGEIKGTLDRHDMDQVGAEKMIRCLMVGREIGETCYREDSEASSGTEIALQIKNASLGMIKDFCLTLHEGEIVGIGGLSGCGMHEVGRIAFGIEKLDSGEVLRKGKKIKDCLDAIDSGVGYVSKNRDTEALILDGSIQDNIVLPSLSDLSKATYVGAKKEKELSDSVIKEFLIKCGNGNQWVSTLSGGNKQKISFGKWIAKGSEVIIMDCPTRGVDVGVKQFMYSVISNMKREGKAILLITEELSELIGLSDRLIIMKDYSVSKEFTRSETLSETDVIEYMI